MDLRVADDEPLAGVPLAVVILEVVHAALHADDGLVILAHGELLQVVVGLEEELADARADQPRGLVALHLHPRLLALRLARHADGIQGEEGLVTTLAPHLQSQRQVLEVDGRGRLHGGGHAHCVCLLVQHEAAEAARPQVALHLPREGQATRDALRPPADVVLEAPFLLQNGILVQTLLVFLLALVLEQLRLALAMHEQASGARVAELADGQAAVRAEHHLLAVRLASRVELLKLGLAACGRGRRSAQLVQLLAPLEAQLLLELLLHLQPLRQRLLRLRGRLRLLLAIERLHEDAPELIHGCQSEPPTILAQHGLLGVVVAAAAGAVIAGILALAADQELLALHARGHPAGLRPFPTDHLILQAVGRALQSPYERARGEPLRKLA
mmetsp:Transcript_2479/g.6378  ORF Transcript_2479/g.6378 Transcript_2479/m.6378 type:complete len:385 (+) Transcript_2479:703-1857(+)